jgi:CelD/BcsL family acetyltransferase involved in cellulose biosynthesis
MLTEVTTAGELHALEPEWSALWKHSVTATPFQSPAWLIAWWTHFGNGALHVLALRGRGELVAVAPFFAYPSAEGHVLSTIGAGITDYHDLLVLPEFADVALHEVGEWLRRRSGWDRAAFEGRTDDAHLLRLRSDATLEAMTEPGEACPVLLLPEMLDAFWARRGRICARISATRVGRSRRG